VTPEITEITIWKTKRMWNAIVRFENNSVQRMRRRTLYAITIDIADWCYTDHVNEEERRK
jgi:hypothetical protein